MNGYARYFSRSDLSAYVSGSPRTTRPHGQDKSGQAGSQVGVYGNRPCRLPQCPLCYSWASVAKWL